MNLDVDVHFPIEIDPEVRGRCVASVREGLDEHLKLMDLKNVHVGVDGYASETYQSVTGAVFFGSGDHWQGIVDTVGSTLTQFFHDECPVELMDGTTGQPIGFQLASAAA